MSSAPPLPPSSIDETDLLRQTLAEKDARIAQLQHTIRVLEKLVFGRGGDKLPTAPTLPASPQGLLFPEFAAMEQRLEQEKQSRDGAETTSAPRDQRRKRGGRRPSFPENAPVVQTILELSEAERLCACGGTREEMDSETRRELERLDLTVVHEIVRKKYCCRRCQEGITIAPTPPQVFDRGMLGPGFLSWLVTERFQNHMPYNRLEKKLRAEGTEVARSVLCENSGRVADVAEVIRNQVLADLLKANSVHLDDTRAIIQQVEGGGSKTGFVWVYADHEGRLVYDFTDSRTRDGPLRILGGYKGYVHADAYSGHDALFAPGGAKEVACCAHIRRKFVDAAESDPLAAEAVHRFDELYVIERTAKESGTRGEALRELRQREATPRLAALLDWLTITKAKVLPKSPLGKAIQYALNQWTAFCRYTEDGDLEIDNNRAERGLRHIAVGRNNWTFVGNETYGKKAAVLFTLIGTCREIGVNPRVYLWDVLQRISVETDVRKLTPHGWKQSFEAEATAAWQAFVAKIATARPRAKETLES